MDSLIYLPLGDLITVFAESWNAACGMLQTACLRGLPPIKHTVFRGISDPPRLADYTQGAKIHWSGFSSTSTDPIKAIEFAGPGGIVFVLNVKTANDIQAFSWFGSTEGELLLSPNMEFLVTSPLHQPTESPLKQLCDATGCQVIEMTEIGKAADVRS